MATKPVEGTAFEVHVKGVATGKTWDGTFRAKPLLTFREQMTADKMQRELVGPDATNADVISQAIIISELQFRLTETPEWWKENGNGLNLSDPNLLEEVYKAARKVSEDYFSTLNGDAEKAREPVKEALAKP
jgi:hypothetical protein